MYWGGREKVEGKGREGKEKTGERQETIKAAAAWSKIRNRVSNGYISLERCIFDFTHYFNGY